MSKINILPSKVFNRIAAGEVVERPMSVVKELVENSIDALSTSIEVEIEDGGISLIKISDNGCGMDKDDLKKSILPHATSKIKDEKDLDSITTLGFRGEALASIASVSKITIESNFINNDNGYSLYSEGGEIEDIKDCAINKGTTIYIRNLFFNAPVRAKFLKTDKGEENEITFLMAKFILGHPEIAFKYISNGKVILQSYKESLESAFVCVYGVKTIKDCYYIDTEKNGIKINGYIGKQNFSKANRSYQTVFLNGRYVVNQTIASSISNAYSPYMMKRQYPFYMLNISVPSEFVDVNVHPNKIDVRFINNQIVYSTIYSVLTKVLDGSMEATNIVVENKYIENLNKTKVDDNKTFVDTQKIENHHINTSKINIDYVRHNNEFDFDKFVFNDSNPLKKDEKSNENLSNDIFLENKAFLEKLEKEKQENVNNITTESASKDNVEQSFTLNRELRCIGQALNTFLILEDGVDLFLIDQHAAHERLLFDKIIDNFSKKEKSIQPLLLPYILELNALEFNFLTDKLQVLRDMGIEISEFGSASFKVSAVPLYLVNLNLEKFFGEILKDINSLKTITATDLLKEKFAQKACKSAIKSGDTLSQNEIDTLLQLINGNLGLKCPHGRPVCIKITRTEIDKWFKRIV